jgi:hypothetical protein
MNEEKIQMANYINSTIEAEGGMTISGNVGKVTGMETINGNEVFKFSVATSYFDRRQRSYETTWVNVSVWGKAAQSAAQKIQEKSGQVVMFNTSGLRIAVNADNPNSIIINANTNHVQVFSGRVGSGSGGNNGGQRQQNRQQQSFDDMPDNNISDIPF